MKRFLFYFGWTIGIGVLLYKGGDLLHYLRILMNVEYKPTPYITALTIYPVLLGIALKTPGSWLQREDMKWGFDWVKFVAVGIPAAYVTLLRVWLYTPFGESLPFLSSMYYYNTIQTVAGIVLGYILLDSLRVPKE